jgi:hypothetical protein
MPGRKTLLKCQLVIRICLKAQIAHHGLFKLVSPASMSMTWRLWSRLANLPATTQPQLPPPSTMMSTSSGSVMVEVAMSYDGCLRNLVKVRRGKDMDQNVATRTRLRSGNVSCFIAQMLLRQGLLMVHERLNNSPSTAQPRFCDKATCAISDT